VAVKAQQFASLESRVASERFCIQRCTKKDFSPWDNYGGRQGEDGKADLT